MSFSVSEIRANLALGGARSTLFQVFIPNPVSAAANLKIPFLCKAASLPGQTLGQIQVGYFGRKIKIAGDRTFQDWQTTIINDEDFLIRNSIEAWSYAINSTDTNLRNFADASQLQYETDATVTQFSKTGVPIREYTFHNIWPVSIDPIQLDWDQADQIEQFNVTWSVDYTTVTGGITGSGT